MTLQGARITERRVYCAVVLVQDAVTLDEVIAERIITAFQNQVCKGPVVLIAQDFQGTPAFYGRADIVRFLQDTDLTKLPWMDYDIAKA
jgi:hypothetical protein